MSQIGTDQSAAKIKRGAVFHLTMTVKEGLCPDYCPTNSERRLCFQKRRGKLCPVTIIDHCKGGLCPNFLVIYRGQSVPINVLWNRNGCVSISVRY